MNAARRLGIIGLVALTSSGAAGEPAPGRFALEGGAVRAHLDATGAQIELGDGLDFSFALERAGRSGLELTLGPGHLVERADGADIVRDALGGVVEWWRERPDGLEHGVTLASRPAGEGPLRLDVAVHGTLRPRDGDHGTSIALLDAHDAVAASYAGLVVLDASGARVPAAMATHDGAIRIEVDDRNARYPLVVDPLLAVLETTLRSVSGSSEAAGHAVAVSADGMRLVVGAPYADGALSDTGLARVFVRTGTMWSVEATLQVGTPTANEYAGWAVAMDATGSRVVVGVPYRDVGAADAGSALVFVRTGATWAVEGTLVAAAPGTGDHFGSAVAISGNGLLVVVGAPDDDVGALSNAGSAHAFTYAAGWSAATAVPAPPGALAQDQLGTSVAIASNGTRMLVGAPGFDVAGVSAGAAPVYLRTGTTATFTHEATLAPSAGAPADDFGRSVAIDGTGLRALVGAPLDDTAAGADAGSGFVFVRGGTAWTLEATLEPSDSAVGVYHGYSVALSGAGDRGLLSAPRFGPGRVVVYERAPTWTVNAPLLPDTGAREFGYAVAMSADGARGVVGDRLASPSQDGSTTVFRLVATLPNGSTCATDGACTSGYCRDGVCCNRECGVMGNDCEACSVARGASADGVCTIVGAGTICRASGGPCDPREVCNGTTPTCPTNVREPAGTTCRAAAGGCDVAEVCNGTDLTCPGDGFAGSGVVCRSDMGDCDVEERCPGTGPSCPTDVISAAGATCRAAVGPCDADEMCDGTSGVCPVDAFLPATTVCDATIAGLCDAPDHCTGAAGNCPARFLTGASCRSAAGTCDTEEFCFGTSVDCPTDAVEAAGMGCRASSAACDPAESCDGVSAGCPADVEDCATDAGPPDAGGPGVDGGAPPAADAGGPPPVAATGCACRSAAGTNRLGHFGSALTLLVVWRLVVWRLVVWRLVVWRLVASRERRRR